MDAEAKQYVYAKLVYLFLLFVISSPKPQVDADQFCNEGTSLAPTVLFHHIKTSFTADLYAVDATAQIGYRVHEHYSAPAEKSAVFVKYKGSKEPKFHIYDKKTGKGYSNFNGTDCQALDAKPRFGFHSLKMFQDQDASYVGQATLRGEQMHLWRKCYTNSNGLQVSEEIYTTGENSAWSNPEGKDYSPVMLVTKVQAKDSNAIDRLNQYIITFQNRDQDEDRLQADLEPPLGVVCSIQPEVALPSLPTSVIYSSESLRNTGISARYIVDQQNQIIVEEEKYLRYQNKLTRSVDSYKLGALFQVPPSYGANCQIKGYAVLGDEGLNSTTGFLDSATYWPFETVAQFLGMNGKEFTFNGERTIRGIPCYTYTKHFGNYREHGEVTLILYITADSVKVRNSFGDKTVTKNVIVGKEVWKHYSAKSISRVRQSIYNLALLDISRLVYNPEDITACDDIMDSIEFGLMLDNFPSDAKIADLSFTDQQKLKDAIETQMAKSAGIDKLRISIRDITTSSAQISAVGKLLGPVPPYQRLKTSMGKFTVNSGNVIKSGRSSAYSCKTSTVKDKTAMAGTYCRSTGTCTLYSMRGNNWVRTYDCVTYSSGIYEEDNTTLNDAWNKLQDSVSTHNFKVGDYTIRLIARFGDTTDKKDDMKTPEILLYKKSPNSKIATAVTTLKNTKLSDCASACTNSLSFDCRRFTYCSSTQLCQLNDETSVDRGDKNCDSYIRTYLTEFTAIEGTSAATDTSLLFEEIDNPSQCARLCLENSDIRCEGFDFCTLKDGGGSGTCSLTKRHFVKAVQSDDTVILLDSKCTHYARDYLGDYNRKPGITSLPVQVQVEDSEPGACARRCSQESDDLDGRCSMFQFCADDNVCQLLDGAAVSSEAMQRNPDVRPKAGCETFSLKDSIYQTHGRWLEERLQDGEFDFLNGSQYGPGDMAALALCMLVLSFALVFLALFVWSRYQTPGSWNLMEAWGKKDKSFDNPSISFSNDEMND